MATEIKTYKERPKCAVPGCNNLAFVYVAGQWICGECCAKWDIEQKKKQAEANKQVFDEIVEVNKE